LRAYRHACRPSGRALRRGTAFATSTGTPSATSVPAYKTTDYGKKWTPLVAADAPVRGYAHVIKQTSSADLLFLGTEFGL
jgi:hypothetical protein